MLALSSGVTLAQQDISYEGGVTVVAQAADDPRTQDEVTASADLFVTLSRPQGEWLLYVEGSSSPDSDGVSAFFPTVNADARSVLTRSGGGTVQVSEFNYTAHLGDENSLMFGLIDPSAWLDRGRIANDENRQFLNGSFVNNATIAFPDYTIGGVYRRKGIDGAPAFTAVVSSSSGIADLPERSYQSLLNVFSGDRGVFAGAGVSWLNKRSSWRLGGWVRTDQEPVIDGSGDTEINYGLYGVFGWQDDANAWNIRAGLANEDLSVATAFAGMAYQRRLAFGTFGIGVAHTEVAQDLRAGRLDPAFDSEVFLRIPVGKSAHVTPSVQYVVNPIPGDDDIRGSAKAFVAGVRFHWAFESGH